MNDLEFMNPAVGDKMILERDVSSLSKVFKKGDEVEIVSIGERGYDLRQGNNVKCGCGWDIFEPTNIHYVVYNISFAYSLLKFLYL